MAAFVTSSFAFRPAFAGAAVSTCVASSARTAGVRMSMSESVPFLEKPANLDGSRVGDIGFDPLYLSDYINLDHAATAEIKHGRICMLATLGFIFPELFHLPGPFFSETNPFKAIYTVPIEGWVQIITVICLVELATFSATYTSGADLGFDPLNFGKPGKLEEYKLKELKNGRLAMVSFLGFVFQIFATGKPILASLTDIPALF